MKKRILVILTSLIVASCDPAEFMTDNQGIWYVENATGKTLTVQWDASIYGEKVITIAPKEKGIIDIASMLVAEGVMTFEKLWAKDEEGERTLWIYDDAGSLLTRWQWADRADESIDFFDESKWAKEVTTYDNIKDYEHFDVEWTYVISEDSLK